MLILKKKGKGTFNLENYYLKLTIRVKAYKTMISKKNIFISTTFAVMNE